MSAGSGQTDRESGDGDGLAIGKTAEEVHADLIAQGLSVTLAEVEAQLEEWAAIGFIHKAEPSVEEARDLNQPADGESS